jgi:hypothetical protein
MKSFKTFLTEGTKLTPRELKKPATGGPNKGMARTEILSNKIRKQEPLTLATGKKFEVANPSDVLASIEQFRKDGKAFELIGKSGAKISSSDLLKTGEFGGGAGAGGGTKATAIGESAQCVWMAAMVEIGYDQPLESFTDKVLTKAFKKVSVGSTSLKDILSIDESWKKSSYLTAQLAIKERIIERGMTFHRDDALMKSIYTAKNTAFKNNGFRPLPDDKWNPGDIWAVDSDFNLKELSTETVEDLNNDILDLYLQKRLVGISLKKVSKGIKAVEKNVVRPPETEDYSYISSHIKSLKSGEWYTTKSNILVFRGGWCEIRANSGFGSHKVEIKGKGARGGGAAWGVMSDAAKRIYGKELPKNSKMKKDAKLIASGDKRAVQKFTKLLQTVDKKISNAEVIEKLATLGKNSDIWIHGKLGGLYVLELISKGGQKANKFVTQIINYAGSSTSDSSAFIILKEK